MGEKTPLDYLELFRRQDDLAQQWTTALKPFHDKLAYGFYRVMVIGGIQKNRR